MARPLRIDVEGGWYHLMSRGIERRVIFLDDSFHFHFLDLLGEMTARFGLVYSEAFLTISSTLSGLDRNVMQ